MSGYMINTRGNMTHVSMNHLASLSSPFLQDSQIVVLPIHSFHNVSHVSMFMLSDEYSEIIKKSVQTCVLKSDHRHGLSDTHETFGTNIIFDPGKVVGYVTQGIHCSKTCLFLCLFSAFCHSWLQMKQYYAEETGTMLRRTNLDNVVILELILLQRQTERRQRVGEKYEEGRKQSSHQLISTERERQLPLPF